MTLRWAHQARSHLRSIYLYVSKDNKSAADRQADLVFQAAEFLVRFPHAGRGGRVDGTREWVVNGTPYIIAYAVEHKVVSILAVEHGAQRWPRSFKQDKR